MTKSELFKTLIWDTIVNAALVQLFAAFPFLGIIPIRYIVNFTVEKFADLVYDKTEKLIRVELIVLKNERARAVFDNASLALKHIAINKGKDSEEFKNARAINQKSLSELMSFNIG